MAAICMNQNMRNKWSFKRFANFAMPVCADKGRIGIGT